MYIHDTLHKRQIGNCPILSPIPPVNSLPTSVTGMLSTVNMFHHHLVQRFYCRLVGNSQVFDENYVLEQ